MHLLAQELVFEHEAVQTTISEVLNGLDLVYTFAGVSKLDPSRQIVLEGLVLALHAKGEVSGPTWPLVGAGEVVDERFVEVLPAVIESRAC